MGIEENELEIKTRRLGNLLRELEPLIPFFETKTVTNVYIYGEGRVQVDDFKKGAYDTKIILPPGVRRRIILSLASLSETPINYWKRPTLESIIPQYNIRTTAIVPPWVASPEITFRKPPDMIFTLEKYKKEKRITEEQYETIVGHIKNRGNIIVGGGTGAGKTTFTNACIEKMREFTPDERFYIIEDIPELQCRAKNKTQLYIRTEQSVSAIQTAMRWSPKRIIFGELRHGEVANELLKAWNTGHPGNITTIHADSAELTMERVKGLLREVITGRPPDIETVVQLCVHLTYKANFGPYVDEIKEYNGKE
ncbi:MAG: Flp pilus assembly complex ATPase component TadA [Spirochaetaceae bacterium]|jgi:type IV secretion system protein VirB11|nr:Flp pilus assembly complex ATPase component TadA [Spirochaetaceae bacterium]